MPELDGIKMVINSFCLTSEEYTKVLNDGKDAILETLRKENILTQEQIDYYKENYALVLVSQSSFISFCRKFFNFNENNKKDYWYKMVKSV